MSIIKKNTRFMLSMSLILGSSFASEWPDDLNDGMDSPFRNEPVLTDFLPSTNIGSDSSMETDVDLPKIQPQKQVSGIAPKIRIKIRIDENKNSTLPNFPKKSTSQNPGLKTPVPQAKPTVQKSVTQNRQVQGSGLQPKTRVVSSNKPILAANRDTPKNVSVSVASNTPKTSNPANYFNDTFDIFDIFSENQRQADDYQIKQEIKNIEAIKATELRNASKAQQSLLETQLPAFVPHEVPVASGGVQRSGVLGNRGRVDQQGIPRLETKKDLLDKKKDQAEREKLREERHLLNKFNEKFSDKFTSEVKNNFYLYKNLMSESSKLKIDHNFDFIKLAIADREFLKSLYNNLLNKKYDDRHFRKDILSDLEILGFVPIGTEGNDKWIYKNNNQLVIRLKLNDPIPGFNLCMYGKDEIISAADSNTKPASGTDMAIRAANKGRNVYADLTKQLCLIYLFPKDNGDISYRLLPSHPGSFSDEKPYMKNIERNRRITRFIEDLLGSEAEKYDIRRGNNIEKYAEKAINSIMQLGHGKFNIDSK